MPSVRIETRRWMTQETKRAVLDAVHASLVMAFVVGFGALVAIMRRVERIGSEQSRRLSAREFKSEVRSGGLLSAGAHFLYFSAFAVGTCAVVFVFRRLSSQVVVWFLLPITFFLTGEMAVAFYELTFSITPCIGRMSSFQVGAGVRKRGAVRATVCVCCVGGALITAALS